jgi:hypothetical protein
MSVSTSPWVVAPPVATKSLEDIMSEELVASELSTVPTGTSEEVDYVYNEEDFMTTEEIAAKRQAEAEAVGAAAGSGSGTSSSDDFVYNDDDFLTDEEKADRDFALALAAQEEESLMNEKNKPKYGNSKVNVCSSLLEHFTYGNSNGASQHLHESSSNFEAEELGAKLMAHAGSGGVAFKNGVANVDGTRVSKHDSLIDGLMNSMSLGEMDGAGNMSGLMVSNTVTNSLKNFSSKQKQKGVYVGGGRVSAKDSRSTSEAVLDDNTRLLLFKLIQKNIFDEVHGVIKTGKESNVYHATKNKVVCDDDARGNGDSSCRVDANVDDNALGVSGSVDVSDTVSESSSVSHCIFDNSDFDYRDVAVKVFKTTLNEFSNRIDYIKGDHRFSREKYAKNSNNKRKFIAQVKPHSSPLHVI